MLPNRPSFSVVSLVALILTLLGILAKVVGNYLPNPPPTHLLEETADFMLPAQSQNIDWRPLGQEAFLEATRTERPIMLLMGVPWGKVGSSLDRDVFSDPNVSTLLNRQFISVRVDGSEHPEMLTAYLPISRERIKFLPGIQIWFLNGAGRPFGFWARTPDAGTLTKNDFLGILSSQRDQFDKLEKDQTLQSEIEKTQIADLDSLERSATAQLDFEGHMQKLLAAIDKNYGGFPIAQVQEPRSYALKYLLLNGKVEEFRAATSKMLSSGIVDVLDGGFFRLATQPDWSRVEFGKVAVQESDLMTTLTIAAVLEKEPYWRYLATRAFDSLTTEFVRDGLLVTSRKDRSKGIFLRDERTSFGPQRLMDLFPDANERSWVAKQLSLDVTQFPQASPRFSDVGGFTDKRLDSVLEKMRNNSKPAQFGVSSYLDQCGTSVANLIRTAGYLGDKVRLDRALDLLDNLDRFRKGGKITHEELGGNDASVYLTDYLALADAHLEGYLATGRIMNISAGWAALLQARKNFKGQHVGIFNVHADNKERTGPKYIHVPEVYDTLGESASAKLSRLSYVYGKLLSSDPEAPRLFQTAEDIQLSLASFLNAVGPSGSSMYCAGAEQKDGRIAFTVGPKSLELGAELRTLCPGRIVAPVYGNVRPDLAKLKPGIYVERTLSLLGPFDSATEAANFLGQTWQFPYLRAGKSPG